MADTLTTSLQLIQQVNLSNPGLWGEKVETNWTRLEAAIALETSVAVTGAGDVTLTSAQQRASTLVFTGTLTANQTVIVAAIEKNWNVFNNTSGAYTLTVKTAAGTGIAVPQAGWKPLRCDGTNVLDTSPTPSFPISDANGLVYDAGDATAIVRIDAGNVTGGNTRVLTMADADIDLDTAAGTFQPRDAELTALAGLTSAADKVPYFTGSGAAAVADFTAYGRSLVAVADEAALKTLVNLEIGTDVLAQQTIGIANDNLLEVDGSPNSGEFARFTANGLEGLTATETRTALNVEDGADVTDATNVAAAGAVMDSDISAGEGFMRKTGAGAYEAIKSNLNSSSNPGTGDDNTAGYAIGSVWINTTADTAYLAVDVSTGAAVWVEITAGAAGGISDVVDDTTPQLGGNLDLNGSGITFPGATVTDITGADTLLVSGTAGTNGNVAMWNADGDLVDASVAAANILVDADIGSAVQAYDAQLFSNIPQNSQSAAYTLLLTDGQKHIFHPSADTTARIWTIPANASVAFPIGTAVTFVNQNSAGTITIAITSDTMRLAGAGTTGSRTLAANGVATALKVTSTEWIISGTGLT